MTDKRTTSQTPAQLKQRKLYTALGYVTGFYGYLNALVEVVRKVSENTRVDSTQLTSDVNRLRNELFNVEAQIRQSMKEIPK